MTKQMDTTKAGVRAYLDKAGEDMVETFHAQKAMRMAVYRFIADAAGLEGEARQFAWKQFKATPSWFGTNCSACRQAFEKKGDNAVAEEAEIEA